MKTKTIVIVFYILCFLQISVNAQNSFTFTPAGATGSAGPTQFMVNSSYTNSSLNGAVTVSLGIQTWTVPFNGTYSVMVYGAKGANTGTYTGGSGAFMSGAFSFSAGTVLKILPGQMGISDGLNGGGGGGSFVVDANNTPLIIAGGGGGLRSLALQNGCPGLTTTAAGLGSGTVATTSCATKTNGIGIGGSSIFFSYGAGGGGFFGVGASDLSTGGGSWSTGMVGGNGYAQGGFGGGGSGNGSYGAGGGGGYSGGNGGFIAGGGGSYNTGANQVNAPGVNSGAGYIVFNRITGINISQTSSITCNGQLTAALTASAFGGVGPYTYSWSTSAVTNSVSGLAAGTYTCWSTDANSNVYISTYTVQQPSALSSSVSSLVNVLCNGGNNGSASVSVSGGVGPYTYTWFPSGGNTSNAVGLSAGLYTLAIKDANNCSASRTMAITQPSPLNVLAFATNPTVCLGSTSTLVAAGALTYTWSGGITNGAAFTPSATAIYSVTGADANGCTASNTTAITVNPVPSLTANGVSTLCAGTNMTINVIGANSYTWSTGSTNTMITVSPTTSVTYSVIGVNSFNCPGTAVKNVTVMSLPTVTAIATNTVICAGYPVVLFAGGANTYTWSGGVSNGVPFNPQITYVYTVTGTDVNGCTNSTTKTISTLTSPTLAISGSSMICPGASASLTVSGAISYTWNNGSTATSIVISPTANTVYSVTGVNAGGCSSNAYQALSLYPQPTVTPVSTNTVVCNGSGITLIATGANNYTWQPLNSNAAYITVTPSVNTVYTLTGASTGGCINSSTLLIAVNNSPVVSIASATSVCLGSAITQSASGANTYLWSNGATTSTVSVNPLASTIYSVTGTSTNGCQGYTTNSIFVEPLPLVTAQANNTVVCQGVSVTLIGGGATTYTWLPINANSAFVNVSPNITSTYTLIGKNTAGCLSSGTVQVNVNSSPNLTINGMPSVCAGATTTLVAIGASTYSWSTAQSGASIIVSPLNTSTYQVTGLSALGCAANASFVINVLALPTISVTGNSSLCLGNTSTLSATGAITYTWSNGSNNSALVVSPTVTTVYNVTGTGSNNCLGQNTRTILVQALPPITAIAQRTLVCVGESLTIYANGGSNYQWSTGSSSTEITVNPTVSTIYTVSGSGVNGCTNTAVATLSVSDCLDVNEKSFDQIDLTIFPNPNNGNFKVSGTVNMNLIILNELGQLVRREQINESENYTVDVKELPSGLYFISTVGNNFVLKRKVVVQN